MRHQVPQFIEVEDKIFGSLSFRQFLYLIGGIAVVVILYLQFGFFLAVLVGAAPLGLGLALAFVKVNNRPFIYFLQSLLTFFMRGRLYLWRKQEKKPVPSSTRMEASSTQKLEAPRISESRLKELAWTLDIKESMYTDSSQVGSSREHR